MKLKYFLCSILTFLVIFADAQEKSLEVKAGYIYQDFSAIDIGINRAFGYPEDPLFFHTSKFRYHLGAQILFMDQDVRIAPQSGIEYYWYFFYSRLNIWTVTDFKKSAFYFTPEIGLSLIGHLYLTYGYNYNLTGKDHYDIGLHRFNLGVNIPIIFK